MVLSQGLGLTLAGVAGGPAVAFAMNGVLASLLFGVQPPDGDAPARRLDRHGRTDCVLSAGAIGEANGSDDRASRRIGVSRVSTITLAGLGSRIETTPLRRGPETIRAT
jgi:hypothetical protein